MKSFLIVVAMASMVAMVVAIYNDDWFLVVLSVVEALLAIFVATYYDEIVKVLKGKSDQHESEIGSDDDR